MCTLPSPHSPFAFFHPQFSYSFTASRWDLDCTVDFLVILDHSFKPCGALNSCDRVLLSYALFLQHQSKLSFRRLCSTFWRSCVVVHGLVRIPSLPTSSPTCTSRQFKVPLLSACVGVSHSLFGLSSRWYRESTWLLKLQDGLRVDGLLCASWMKVWAIY